VAIAGWPREVPVRRLAVVLSVVVAAGVCPAQGVVSPGFAAYQAVVEPLPGDFNGDGFADVALVSPVKMWAPSPTLAR
jgi:FG-GAP repeat